MTFGSTDLIPHLHLKPSIAKAPAHPSGYRYLLSVLSNQGKPISWRWSRR